MAHPQQGKSNTGRPLSLSARISAVAAISALLGFFLPWLTLQPLGRDAVTWSGIRIAQGSASLSVSGYPLLFVTLGAAAAIALAAALALRARRAGPVVSLVHAILAPVGLWHVREGYYHLLIEYGAPYRLATPGIKSRFGLWLVVAGLGVVLLAGLVGLVASVSAWLLRTWQAQPPGYYRDRLLRTWRVVRLPLGFALLLAGTFAFLDWNAAESTHPTWSPAGNAIAFESDWDGKPHRNDIYVMGVESGEVQRLTDHPLYDGHADWSPDGTQLAFTSYRDGLPAIYVVDVAGGEMRRVTSPDTYASDPAWHPGGRHIYFTVLAHGGVHTYLTDVRDGSTIPMPDQIPWERGHALSPDGQRVAFLSSHEGELDLYTCTAEGSDIRRLNTGLRHPGAPAWSWDGERLALTAWDGGDYRIYVVNADGSGLRQLSDGRGQDRLPAWAPDGQTLALVSGRSGRDEVYLLDVNGGELQRLTRSRRIPWLPAWVWRLW